MKKRVLITVLTYPCPSEKYIETVCTAGITDQGEWIRIYPLKLRLLQKSLHKFNWYDFEVEKRSANKDFRKESFHCLGDPDCISKGYIKPSDDGWKERKAICVDQVGYYSNLNQLRIDSNVHNKDFISLATFKPTKLLDFSGGKERRIWIFLIRRKRILSESSKTSLTCLLRVISLSIGRWQNQSHTISNIGL